MNTSVRIFSTQAEFRTEHLPNKSPERYLQADLFRKNYVNVELEEILHENVDSLHPAPVNTFMVLLFP
jgi:hypothetical protein